MTIGIAGSYAAILGAMAAPDRRKRSRPARIRDALVWGTIAGAAGGAALAGVPGALIGSVLFATSEGIAARGEALAPAGRGPAEPKPLAGRIAASALLMALFGWLLGLAYGSDHTILTAILSGALMGLFGLRPFKVALGIAIGAIVGVALDALGGTVEPALVAAVVTVVYRLVAAVVYRKRPLVRIMAEEVPAAELRYVVPFEARAKYVGADYVEQLAKLRGGTFQRNPP